jgi:hypothetical protein
MPSALSTGSGAVVATLLGSTLFGSNEPVELPTAVQSVNVDDALLSEWISEGFGMNSDEPLENECNFYNFTTTFNSPFCDAFTVSRMQTQTIRVAQTRALKCAARHGLECVLSAEVGLAVPAAFVVTHFGDDGAGMRAIVAPRLVAPSHYVTDATPTQSYVRTSTTKDAFGSQTIKLNDSVAVEFMTDSKRVAVETFRGSDAYCIQLLRLAFHTECWHALDR